MLIESGINMNFAPVADIYNNSLSKALYKRCFYGNYNQVAKNCITYIKTANENNIISVIKHYPGHGATKMDSHFFIPYIFNYKNVLNKHIIPFDNSIKENVPAIMVGHIIVRKLTGLLPASISNKLIDNYLRKNNYDGLIISDEINMLKRNIIYHFNYLDKSLKSNNDIILIKIKDINEGYNIIDKYKKILENDKYKEKLDEYVGRILNTKEKYNITDNIKFKGINIDDINKEIDLINNGI